MSAMQQLLVIPQVAAELIPGGATLAIAGDESVLATLPLGNGMGGAIPYFTGQGGGVTTLSQVFVTPLSPYPGHKPYVKLYDTASLSQVCVEAPENGFSVIILPAFSEAHYEYAQHASLYDDMFMKPLVGWVPTSAFSVFGWESNVGLTATGAPAMGTELTTTSDRSRAD